MRKNSFEDTSGVSCTTPQKSNFLSSTGSALSILRLKWYLYRLRSDDTLAQKSAVEGLVKLGDRRAIKPLLKLLAHPHAYYYAGSVLEKLKPPKEDLLNAYLHALSRRNNDVVGNAVRALAKLGDRSAIDPLYNKFTTADYWLVKDTTAEALAELGDRRVTEYLLTLVSDETNCYRAAGAIEALASLGERSAKEPAIRLLSHSDSFKAARGTLLKLGFTGAQLANAYLQVLDKDYPLAHWENMMDELEALDGGRGKELLWELVTKKIAHIESTEDVSTVELYRRKDYRFEQAAAIAIHLGKSGDMRVIDFLLKLMEQKAHIEEVMPILGSFGDKRAFIPLFKVATDSYGKTKEKAEAAIERLTITREEKIEAFLQCLSMPNTEVRKKAKQDLQQLGATKRQLADTYLNALTSNNEEVCAEAIEALGALGDERAKEHLYQLLSNQVRKKETLIKTAIALGRLGDQRAVEFLIRIIEYFRLKFIYAKEIPQLSEAITVLVELGDSRSKKPLLRLLATQNIYGTVNVLTTGDGKYVSKVFSHRQIREALEILSATRDELIDVYLQALSTYYPSGFETARDALQELGATPAQLLAGYIHALSSSNYWKAEKVLEKLNVPSEQRLDGYVKALSSSHKEARRNAASVLIKMIPRGVLRRAFTRASKYEYPRDAIFSPLTEEGTGLIRQYLDGKINIETAYIPSVTHIEKETVSDPYGDYTTDVTIVDEPPKIVIAKSSKDRFLGKRRHPQVTTNLIQTIRPPFKADVPSWILETKEIDAYVTETSPLRTESDIKDILCRRSWIWNSITDPVRQHEAERKIMMIRTKASAVVEILYDNNLVSHSIVSLYLMGSYPWLETANDVDIVLIVEGDAKFRRISSRDLTVQAEEFIPGLKTSFEIVGLETLKRAARGADVDMAKVIRRKLVTYSGAIPLAGVDIFAETTPPVENYRTMQDDLLRDAELARWDDIKSDPAKVELKKRWRSQEAEALGEWIKKRERSNDAKSSSAGL